MESVYQVSEMIVVGKRIESFGCVVSYVYLNIPQRQQNQAYCTYIGETKYFVYCAHAPVALMFAHQKCFVFILA